MQDWSGLPTALSLFLLVRKSRPTINTKSQW